jgi:hypothetical protein
MRQYLLTATALAASIASAHPALAAPGDPVKIADGLTLDPIIDARLRYERVDQPTLDADALTLRLRAGFEARHKSGISFLAEAEGTLGIVNDYNAFPFAIVDSQRRPQFSVVADPMNVELNRLQLQYKSKAVTVTVGRQRINLDDQRWVGAVGWRQNEQTFDAVRGEAKIGPVSLDATYAIDQRSIWGIESGPRQGMDGDHVFLGAGAKAGPVQLKAFAYLLDYDDAFFTSNSSQTYGVRAVAAIPLTGKAKLNLAASYARQSDYGSNPFNYSADYIAAEASTGLSNFTLTAGYELLGSNGTRSVQTPMATLHKFNGWADVFLTTPAAGLEDWYGGVAIKFPSVKALPGLNAAVTYHRFESDIGSVHYGDEWNASLGFKLKRFTILAKYADYDAAGFGADMRKFWLQAEIAY